MRKKLKRILALAMLLCFLLPALAPVLTLRTEAAASSLTVKVRYWGLAEYTKGTYSVAEVEAMGLTSALYTMNTNGGFLAYANAEGVSIDKILYAAGVNVGALSYCNFLAVDGHNAGKNFYYGELFGAGYAFPDASLYFEEGVGITDPDALWASATAVYPMLAVRENYSRVSGGTEYVPAAMDGSHCFRLMLPQQYPGHVMATDSIYDINTIVVTYSGYPQIKSADEVTVSLNEDKTLEVRVDSADSDLTQIIAGGLKFRSSDPAIVSVDASGKLTAHGKGEAEIEIYYESTDIDESNLSKTVRVVVGDGEGGSGGNGEGTGTGDGEGPGGGGTGSGNGEGDGTGEGEGSGSGGAEDGTGEGGGGSGSTDGAADGSGESSNPEPEQPDKENTGDSENQGGETVPTDPVPDPTEAPDEPTEAPDPTEVPEETTPVTEPPATEPPAAETTPPTEAPEAETIAVTEAPEEDEPEDEVLLSETDAEDLESGGEPAQNTLQVRRVVSAGARQNTASASQQGGAAGGTAGGSAAMTLTLEDNPMLLFAGIVTGVLFLGGGAGMFVLYIKEI